MIERLRTRLWWLEPRPQVRGGLRYGYVRGWHLPMKKRAARARALFEDLA